MNAPPRVPKLPSTMPGGMMLPHMSARMRTHTIDTVFEMIGGTERLAHWAGKNDDNYGEYVTKVWAKGAAKAVVQEHSLGEGVEDLLAQLARAENAQTIEGAYEETLESD